MSIQPAILMQLSRFLPIKLTSICLNKSELRHRRMPAAALPISKPSGANFLRDSTPLPPGPNI